MAAGYQSWTNVTAEFTTASDSLIPFPNPAASQNAVGRRRATSPWGTEPIRARRG